MTFIGKVAPLPVIPTENVICFAFGWLCNQAFGTSQAPYPAEKLIYSAGWVTYIGRVRVVEAPTPTGAFASHLNDIFWKGFDGSEPPPYKPSVTLRFRREQPALQALLAHQTKTPTAL